MTKIDPENTGTIRYSDFLAVLALQAQKRKVNNQVQKASDRLRTMVKQRERSKNGSFCEIISNIFEKKTSFNSSQWFKST